MQNYDSRINVIKIKKYCSIFYTFSSNLTSKIVQFDLNFGKYSEMLVVKRSFYSHLAAN